MPPDKHMTSRNMTHHIRHRFFPAFLLMAAMAMLAFPPAAAAAARDGRAIHEMLATGGKGGWLHTPRPLTAADMKGRLVLLDFWTYGCINCMHVVPDLAYLEETFGPRLLVVGVHSAKFDAEQGNDRIEAAARRFGLRHPVINDSDYAIWKAMKVRAWPTLVLLGPDGDEIGRYVGEGHRDRIAADILGHIGTARNDSALPAPAAAGNDGGLLSFPARLAHAAETPWGPLLFIADSGHHRILGVDGDGTIRVKIGNGARGLKDGTLADAQFNHPRGMAIMNGFLYIADTDNHAIRRADLKAGTVATVAGTGEKGYERHLRAANARATALASPWDVEPMADGRLAIAHAGTHQLWAYDAERKTLSVIAGNGGEDVKDGRADRAELAQPSGLSQEGGTLFFVDAESSALRALTPDGRVETLVGTGLFDFGMADGAYPKAMMQHPQGLSADRDRIIVADTYNNAVRVYDRAARTLATLPLRGGGLNEPGDVLPQGGRIYIADTNAHDIKILDSGTGALSSFPLRAAAAPSE